jgi:putative cell wall-binding protein
LSRKPLRVTLAAGLAVGVGVGAMLTFNGAFASHAGLNRNLTATNGSKTLRWASTQPFGNGTTLTSADTLTDGAWSPDGSRLVYVDGAGDVATMKYFDATDRTVIVAAENDNAPKSHPSYSSDGAYVIWSEKSPGEAASLFYATSEVYAPVAANLPTGFDYTHPDAGGANKLVFERRTDSGGSPTGTPDVVVIDQYDVYDTDNVIAPTLVVSNAFDPSVSPDGSRVAWVRTDGSGDDQVFTSDLDGGNAVQITPSGTGDYANPTWSPDGVKLAFSKGTAIYETSSTAQAVSLTAIAGLTGVPAYESDFDNPQVRYSGSNRFGTAVLVSQDLWATAGAAGDDRLAANSVVLSRSDTYADALSGSALAAAKQGPLLMTPPTGGLNPDTRTEIQRVLGGNTSDTVYVLGSTTAISTQAENEVKAMGYTVVRLAGANRYATSIKIATAISAHPDIVLAATGANFPDALSAGAAAGSYDYPGSDQSAVVVLTAGTALTSDTTGYLNAALTANPDLLLFGIGGDAAAALTADGYPMLAGLVGQNRYETANLVADVFFPGAQETGVAVGTNWPDALSGGAMMATLNGPLLLSPHAGLDADTYATVSANSPNFTTARLFGSNAAVGETAAGSVCLAMSGQGGCSVSTLHNNAAAGANARSAPSHANVPAHRQRPSHSQLRLTGTHVPQG